MPPFRPQLPDLDLFKAVAPSSQPIDLSKSQTIDGTPMIGPDGLLVPAARSFTSIVNTSTKVYSYRYDEAMRDNFVAARAMKRDAFLLGLFEERVLPTVNREFTIEVDDDRDPEQAYVRDGITRILRNTRNFDAFKRALMEGVWFGRAGCQWSWERKEEVDNYWGLGKWDPIHGDSVQFSFDGYPCIMMDTATTSWYASHGAKYGPPGVGDLVPTDRGGTALQLHRPYWRERFAIHQHLLQKADYFEGELAGSVQGLGLRGQVYWQYVVRTDALTWMLAYMQAVGQMDLLVFNYPTGNAAAQRQQELNAQQVIGKAAIACPRPAQGNWPAIEQIPMNSAGLAALQTLVADYFDRHIERLFVGQSMSSGADKGTGLGGTGRAEFAMATKDEILVFDSKRLDETITYDLIGPLKKYNFPWAKFPVRYKGVLPDLQAQEKVMSGKVLISVGVPIKADEFREAAGYSRPEPGDDVVGAPPAMGPGGAPPSPGGAPGAGGPPPVWMGAPGGPPSPPPGGGGPAMLSRANNPSPYMGSPGGSNTYIPSFSGDEKPVGFTRYQRTPTAYHDLPHKHCSTQIELVGEAQMRVLQASSGIPEDALIERELDAHVTILYGLEDADPGPVQRLVKGFGPITLRLTTASLFENEDADVLKFDVESEDLKRLNRILKKLPHAETHPVYKPHATSAYLKPGRGWEYAYGLKPLNVSVLVDGFYLTDRLGQKVWISTTGKPPGRVEEYSQNAQSVPSAYSREPLRYWMQSPPGGAILNGKEYRSGRFVPGTTMFTHGGFANPKRNIQPEKPVLYDPAKYGPVSYAPPSGQPDGTHALPMPATAPQAVQGAPQTVGGEPMFPSQGQQPQESPQTAQGAPIGGLSVGAPPQVRPQAAGPQIQRTPGLSPEDQMVEAQSQMFAMQNYGQIRDLYFQGHVRTDPTSGDVRSLTIDSDGFKELLPGYTGMNGSAVGAAARYLSDQLFREALRNQTGKGNGKMMILSGSTSGSADTSVGDYLQTAEYPLVLDKVGSDYLALNRQFEEAQAAGMTPEFMYVDRAGSGALETAVEDAIERRQQGQPPQTDSLQKIAERNAQARRTALEVLFRNPNVKSTVVDEDGGYRFQRRLIVDRMEAAQYLAQRITEDEAELRAGGLERIKQDLIARHKAGEVGADVVTALLGDQSWNVRPPIPLPAAATHPLMR